MELCKDIPYSKSKKDPANKTDDCCDKKWLNVLKKMIKGIYKTLYKFIMHDSDDENRNPKVVIRLFKNFKRSCIGMKIKWILQRNTLC